jgi:hypothetical protein
MCNGTIRRDVPCGFVMLESCKIVSLFPIGLFYMGPTALLLDLGFFFQFTNLVHSW